MAAIQLLRMLPSLRLLSQPTIDQLAATLEHTSVAAGERLLEPGEIGDRVYVVEAGPIADRGERPHATRGVRGR
jgi:CRP-like cAMP-binding protein